MVSTYCMSRIRCKYYGLFTFSDSDSDSYSDCKPNGHIVVCKTFHTVRSSIQIPVLTANYRNGIGIGICDCK